MKTPSRNSPLLAEEIGIHLGDGSMNWYKGKGFYQLRGHLIDDRQHYETRIRYLYKKLYGLDINLREMRSTGVFGFQIWNDDLVKFKETALGLPTGKKSDFAAPKNIEKNKELTTAFLRGIFDTDGCLYIENKRGKPYPKIEISTVSQKFCQQLNRMLKNTSFRPTQYTHLRADKGWNDLHRLRLSGLEQTEKWFRDIKPANKKFEKKRKKVVW